MIMRKEIKFSWRYVILSIVTMALVNFLVRTMSDGMIEVLQYRFVSGHSIIVFISKLLALSHRCLVKRGDAWYGIQVLH